MPEERFKAHTSSIMIGPSGLRMMIQLEDMFSSLEGLRRTMSKKYELEEAIRILKNEPHALGNHGEAVESLKANRIVVADTSLDTFGSSPVWNVESVDIVDDSHFQEMKLYRRAEEDFAHGLYWARSRFEAWLHTAGSPENHLAH